MQCVGTRGVEYRFIVLRNNTLLPSFKSTHYSENKILQESRRNYEDIERLDLREEEMIHFMHAFHISNNKQHNKCVLN